jgi:hypothetical protein
MEKNFSDVPQELKWAEYTVQQVETGLWRVQGLDGELPIGETVTSDQVINFYNFMNNLVHRLGHLAMNWRGEKSQDLVSAYHETIKKLWDLGWRGSDFLPDEELPHKLMPDYFVSYWTKRRREYNQKHGH